MTKDIIMRELDRLLNVRYNITNLQLPVLQEKLKAFAPLHGKQVFYRGEYFTAVVSSACLDGSYLYQLWWPDKKGNSVLRYKVVSEEQLKEG